MSALVAILVLNSVEEVCSLYDAGFVVRRASLNVVRWCCALCLEPFVQLVS